MAQKCLKNTSVFFVNSCSFWDAQFYDLIFLDFDMFLLSFVGTASNYDNIDCV